MNRNTTWLLLAAGALAYLLLRRKDSAGVWGGGSASGGGGGGGQQPGGQPATNFRTVVNPGGGSAPQLVRSLSSGLNSGIALNGDVGGLFKGIGQIGKDLFNAFTGLFTKPGERPPFSDPWQISAAAFGTRNDLALDGYNRADIDPALRGLTFSEWSGFQPARTDLSQRSFGLGDDAFTSTPFYTPDDWSWWADTMSGNFGDTATDNVVQPLWESPFGTSTLSYDDSPFSLY